MPCKSKRSQLFSSRIRKNLAICAHSSSSLIYEGEPGNLEEKESLFGTKLLFLEERDEEILSERIIDLSRSSKARSALQLFVSVDASGLRPNSHACNSLIACLIRNGSVNDALRVFETVRRKGVATCHTYSLVLKAVASVQGCDSALKLFSVLEGEAISKKNFDIIVYNTMVATCGKAKNWVEVERLWRVFKENELSGTMITYSLLVSTFVQCGQMELALDAYHEMIDKGLDPIEDIMKAVVSCSTKEGNWPVALKVFEEMLKKGMKPNVITYNAVINCLGKAGEVDVAFRICDVMKSSGLKPDVYTWNALLTALYRSKQFSDVLQFFKGIKTKEPSQLNSHLYNTALMACQRLGLWERSLQLLWEMETSGIQISTLSYNHVISTCEAARKPRVALQVYQHMVHQKCAPDTFTYLSLIRACVWGSLWMEAEKILEVCCLCTTTCALFAFTTLMANHQLFAMNAGSCMFGLDLWTEQFYLLFTLSLRLLCRSISFSLLSLANVKTCIAAQEIME